MTITAEKESYTCDGCGRQLPFHLFGALDSVSGVWHCNECITREGQLQNLDHLLRLARRGKEGHGASNAERQAYALVRGVLQNIPGLDGTARAGLVQLIEMTARAPMETSDAVRDALSPRRSIQPVRARIAEVRS